MKQEKVKSLTGVKNALLKHKKVWITVDGESWIYAERKENGRVWINFGLSAATRNFRTALTEIYDFLSFKKSIDLL